MSSSSLWTDKETELLKLLRPNHTNSEIASTLTALGFSRNSSMVEKKAKREKIKHLSMGELDTDSLEDRTLAKALNIIYDERLLSASGALPNLAPVLTKRQANRVSASLYENTLQELKDIHSKAKKKAQRTKVTSIRKSEKESLCIQLSDLHVGKKVELNGNITFDLEIAERRLSTLGERVIKLLGSGRMKDFDEVVIMVNGDIVDGEGIYQTQAFHVDTFVANQCRVAAASIWEIVQTFLKCSTIKSVRLVTAPGNHGRVSYYNHEQSNWDNIVSMMLAINLVLILIFKVI